MDKDYLKGIISRLCKEKEERHLSPAMADTNDVLRAVREDCLATMRQMCEEGVLSANRLLNGAALRCV